MLSSLYHETNVSYGTLPLLAAVWRPIFELREAHKHRQAAGVHRTDSGSLFSEGRKKAVTAIGQHVRATEIGLIIVEAESKSASCCLRCLGEARIPAVEMKETDRAPMRSPSHVVGTLAGLHA